MKTTVKLTILLGLIFFTACSGLKKSFGSSEFNKSYKEELSAFSTQSKGKTLTLLGAKHSYLFVNALKASELLKAQKLLKLQSSNFSLAISVKEYKSSIISLRIFSHFEKSKLTKEQISWFESHDVPLELRAFGGKKSEPRPTPVLTYVELIELKGERKTIEANTNPIKLTPKILLEVSEHISNRR